MSDIAQLALGYTFFRSADLRNAKDLPVTRPIRRSPGSKSAAALLALLAQIGRYEEVESEIASTPIMELRYNASAQKRFPL